MNDDVFLFCVSFGPPMSFQGPEELSLTTRVSGLTFFASSLLLLCDSFHEGSKRDLGPHVLKSLSILLPDWSPLYKNSFGIFLPLSQLMCPKLSGTLHNADHLFQKRRPVA